MNEKEHRMVQSCAYGKSFLAYLRGKSAEEKLDASNKMLESYSNDLMKKLIEGTNNLLQVEEDLVKANDLLMKNALEQTTLSLEKNSYSTYSDEEWDNLIKSMTSIIEEHRKQVDLLMKKEMETGNAILIEILSTIQSISKDKETKNAN